MKSIIVIIFVFLATTVFIGLSLWWTVYQYQVCKKEVSKNTFYCLQHAL